jgi:predicted NAD-dependent protein-ADP-ribosyltransferase YbiA (DUF1768 family)
MTPTSRGTMGVNTAGDATEPIYFYGRDNNFGFLSQMFVSPFEVDGIAYETTEHYFQATKARKFGDFVRPTKDNIHQANSQ